MTAEPKQLPLVHKPINNHRSKWLSSLVGLAVLVAVSWGVIVYLPQGIDMLRAYNYKPTEQIASINDRINLTTRGGHIFYASTPAVSGQEEFNSSCGSHERTAAILGCFYMDKIYLYDVDNAELDGVMEVTAAHELLHAAYQRLGPFERERIDRLIEDEYQKLKDIPEIREAMEYYSEAEPGEELNELHSIIGTTIASISPQLEKYYERYFTDRASIVELNQRYVDVFNRIKSQSEALEKEVNAKKAVVDQRLAEYDKAKNQLEADINDFNRRAGDGSFTSMATFESQRRALNFRVDSLNAQREEVNRLVNEYNALVEELNSLAIHANQLYKSINGAVATEEGV